MQTPYGHLTYCSNIHPGESWPDHFSQLQQYIPAVKAKVSPDQSFGIGLRLSNTASIELAEEKTLQQFREWLQAKSCYVFTMNGFPYGGFHNTVVKDAVHAPNWTTAERVQYTIRLVNILAALLPSGMEGSISTSPLSYQHWHSETEWPAVMEAATKNLLQVVEKLIAIKQSTGRLIHIDIEPEPDGLLGDGPAFFDWYTNYLLPIGVPYLQAKFSYDEGEASDVLKEHVQLCYDVCHFAVGYEDHADTLQRLRSLGIKTGKLQISAALKANLPRNMEKRKAVIEAFQQFNEPVYLHQVIARQADGSCQHYADLPDALADAINEKVVEWRAHFHVPLFLESFGLLQSTQQDIRKVLELHLAQPFTTHLEVETYTWEVLPPAMQVPVAESIGRELAFVIRLLKQEPVDTHA